MTIWAEYLALEALQKWMVVGTTIEQKNDLGEGDRQKDENKMNK